MASFSIQGNEEKGPSLPNETPLGLPSVDLHEHSPAVHDVMHPSLSTVSDLPDKPDSVRGDRGDIKPTKSKRRRERKRKLKDHNDTLKNDDDFEPMLPGATCSDLTRLTSVSGTTEQHNIMTNHIQHDMMKGHQQQEVKANTSQSGRSDNKDRRPNSRKSAGNEYVGNKYQPKTSHGEPMNQGGRTYTELMQAHGRSRPHMSLSEEVQEVIKNLSLNTSRNTQKQNMVTDDLPRNSSNVIRSDNRKGLKQKDRKPNNEERNRKCGSKMRSFENYWDSSDVQQGLKRGHLIQGPIRINPKNFEEAYIPHPDGVSDIFISGIYDRNRALNADVVAVSLKPEEEWKVLVDNLNDRSDSIIESFNKLNLEEDSHTKEAIDGTTEKPPGASSTEAADSKNVPKNAGSKKRHTSLGDLFTKEHIENTTISPAIRRLFEANVRENNYADAKPIDSIVKRNLIESIPKECLVRTGKVVYIVERKHSRACTGHIKLQNNRNRDWALFAPIDHRLPRILVPMSDCPKDFFERPHDHALVLFICRITEWKEASVFAFGTLAKSLGEAGEIEPETEGMLIEYDVDATDFSDDALQCLPRDLPWSIPRAEYGYRRDLRKDCIFTIDPSTARDLDDALSVSLCGDGIYEVGVHIADVSYFVPEDTSLDRVASERSTSVYLVQKVIPMLPRLLCEKLCSLNPDEERLTFSVIWRMTETGEIIDEWFGRSIIRSCVKLSYDHAQSFIAEPDRGWTTDELPPISNGFTVKQIQEKVLHLHKIAQNLRKGRFDGGALRLDQVKIQFALDKETGMPNGYHVYEQRESNKLVEEFMLLANMAVANKIYQTYPEVSVLRRHPPPQTRQVDDLVSTCKSLGINIDASTAGALQRSLVDVSGDTIEAKSKLQILTVLCSKPMQNARYFCTGVLDNEEDFRHYALNVPLYTHFTSPIRRYPDIMVHRCLAAALGYISHPGLDKAARQVQCEHSNDKKMNAKRVQERSSELFFSAFVKECGPIEESGMVMAVLDHSFDVLILKLGITKRVYCEKLPLKEYIFRKHQKRPELTLIWSATEYVPQEHRQVISIFTSVECILTGGDEPMKYNVVTKHPQDQKPN